MESISTSNLAIMENTEHLIFNVCTPIINLKMGVSLDHCVSLLFVSVPALQTFWLTFQSKNNVRSALASTALA